MEDLSQMKYLEMVIKESMRLYPPIPMWARWLDEDITIEVTTRRAFIFRIGFLLDKWVS